jgi:hypothetical protein
MLQIKILLMMLCLITAPQAAFFSFLYNIFNINNNIKLIRSKFLYFLIS